MIISMIRRVFWALGVILILLSSLPSYAGPTIGTIYPSASPRVNTRFELTFTLADIQPKNTVFPINGDFGYNPFWQDTTTSGSVPTAPGVKVWAVITAPDGSSFTLNGFWCVEYQYLGDSQSGYDRIVPVNHPQTHTAEHWHVRFIPAKAGIYSATVYADDPDPASPPVSATTTFTVAAASAGDHGILHVSDDGQRVELVDGTPYCQFGFDMPQGCPAVEGSPVLNGKKGLEVLADAGGNFVRRWIVNTSREDVYRGISWYRGANESYDSTVARSGVRSLKATLGGPQVTVVDRSFLGCLGNRTYTGSIWFKGGDGQSGTVRMRILESNGTITTERAGVWVDIAPNEWRQATLTFTTASDAKWLHFKPQSDGGHGDLYLDDMDVRDTTPGSAVDFNMIQNPSFEDWSPVELDTANLWRTDYCLQKCEQLGIKVQLCLFDYRLWNSIVPAGFYFTWYGDTFWGDCSTGTWQETDCVKQQKRMLKYLAARYGGYPSLGLWELTNEMSPWFDNTRYNWLKEMSGYLRSIDLGYGGTTGQRPITNSCWYSPADPICYEQLPDVRVSTVHSYMYSNTNPGLKNRVPGWGMEGCNVDSTSCTSYPNAYHVPVVYPSEMAQDTLVGTSFGTHPNKFYKLEYSVKIASMTGSAPKLSAHYFRLDTLNNTIADELQTLSATTGWTQKQMSWTAGPTDAKVTIRFDVANMRSIEVWLDDIKLSESDDGITWHAVSYNSDLSITNLGDDEFVWALYNSDRFRNMYTAGPNGYEKAWLSGESGLFDWSISQNGWVFSQYAGRDNTGIHSHNIIWAQTMVSGALNSPCYWFSQDYMVSKAAAGIDVYTPTWKGITQFLKLIPFGSGSQLICTDPFFSQVSGVSSSDAKIRMVGRKKDNAAYFWVSNNTNTWANRLQQGNPTIAAYSLLGIPGFAPGSYSVSNYDSYTGALISNTSVTVTSDGILKVGASNVSTDTAFIVTLLTPQPPHPLANPDGTVVELSDFIVFAQSNHDSGMYIESESRAWGIKVIPPDGVPVWCTQKVNVKGTLQTVNGERCLQVPPPPDGEITVTAFGAQLRPLVVSNKAMGGVPPGQYTPLIKDGQGLYNVGMLVKCIGKVTAIGSKFFYIDDGAGLSDGSGYTGLRVELSQVPNWMYVNDRVVVLGASSVAIVNNQVVRTLRPKTSWDIYVTWSPRW